MNKEQSLNTTKLNGFTMIELLVVITIIGIISSIIFGMAHYVFDLQDRKKAKAELSKLRTATEDFKVRYGNYPHCPMKVCDPGECFFLSLMGYHNGKGALQFPPLSPIVNPARFDYGSQDMDPKILNAFAQGGSKASQNLVAFAFERDINFCDPWGTPYAYEYPRQDGIGGFRLFSLGPDGKTGKDHSEDDIQ